MTTTAVSAAADAAMAAVREATAYYHCEDAAAHHLSSSLDGLRDDDNSRPLEDDDDGETETESSKSKSMRHRLRRHPPPTIEITNVKFPCGRGDAVLGDVPDTTSSSSSSSRRVVPVPGYAPLPPPPLSPPRRSLRRPRQRQRQRQPDGDDEDEIRERITIELENVPSKAEEERRHEVEQHTKVATGIECRTEREEEEKVEKVEKVEKEDATAAAKPVAVAAEADPCSSIEIDKKEKEEIFHHQFSIDLVPVPSSVAGATASRRNCRPLRRNNTSGGEGLLGDRSSDPRRWSFSERHGSHRHRNGSGNNRNDNGKNNNQERRCSTPSTTMVSLSSLSTHRSIGSNGSSRSHSQSKRNNDHSRHHSGNETKTRYNLSHHHHQLQQLLQQQQPRNGEDIQTRRQTDKHPSIALSMKTTLSPSSSPRPRTMTPRRRRRRQTISSAIVETPTHPSDLRSSFAKRHGNEVIRGSGNANANTKANAYRRQSSAPQSRGDTSTFHFDSRIHCFRSGRSGKDEVNDDDHHHHHGVGNGNNNGGGGTVARSNPATKSRTPLEKEMQVWKNDVEVWTFRSEVVELAEGRVLATATTTAVPMPPMKQPPQRRVQQMQQSEKKCVRRLGVPVLVTKSNF